MAEALAKWATMTNTQILSDVLAGEVWPDELDALHAAPQYHTLLFENESVRVLDTTVPPGQTVPLHTHRWPAALYMLSWSDFVRRDAEGSVMTDSRLAGKSADGIALWSGPLAPHTLENVGESKLQVISVEFKTIPC
ncbi:MAG TPA: hypothetical protein VF018_14955 [Acidobacteriaceae bacterium]